MAGFSASFHKALAKILNIKSTKETNNTSNKEEIMAAEGLINWNLEYEILYLLF